MSEFQFGDEAESTKSPVKQPTQEITKPKQRMENLLEEDPSSLLSEEILLRILPVTLIVIIIVAIIFFVPPVREALTSFLASLIS